MQGVDLDLFRDIPGYKAILKAVLKSQIQVLVEQLSQQAGEESVLLTASIEEGTLSHLGSNTGRFFIDGHSNIKSQFLGFCMKRHRICQQQSEPTLSSVKRKRGPYTSRRIQNSTREQTSAVKRHDGLYPPFTNVINTASASKKSQNFSIRSKKNLAFNFSPVQKADRLKLLPAPTLPMIHIKTEPVSMIEMDEDNKSEGEQTVKSENWSVNMENQYEDSDVNYMYGEIGNQTEAKENLSQGDGENISGKPENQSVDSENQLKLCAKQSESGNRTKKDGDEGESTSFMVVTEAGDQVYQGRLDDEDQNKSSEINGTEPPSGTRSPDLSINNNLDLDLYLTSETTDDRSTNIISKPKPDFPRNLGKLRKQKSKGVYGVSKQSKDKKLDSMNCTEYENRPYPCTMCPKRFKERHHLTYHLRTHSGQRPYACDICSKTFTQTSSLKVHRKRHVNDVSCGACGQTFRGVAGFSKHACYVTQGYS